MAAVPVLRYGRTELMARSAARAKINIKASTVSTVMHCDMLSDASTDNG